MDVLQGLISLGGGLPSSEYFPFERLDIKVPAPPHFSEAATKESGIVKTSGKRDIADGKSIFGTPPHALKSGDKFHLS